MTTIELIKEAITALEDRTGSSIVAITKFIESEKKVRVGGRIIGFFENSEFCEFAKKRVCL